jgi:plastocyanin
MFSGKQAFGRPSIGETVPKGLMQHYVFVPTSIRAKPGEIVSDYNDDQLLHRIVADDGSFDTLDAPGR